MLSVIKNETCHTCYELIDILVSILKTILRNKSGLFYRYSEHNTQQRACQTFFTDQIFPGNGCYCLSACPNIFFFFLQANTIGNLVASIRKGVFLFFTHLHIKEIRLAQLAIGFAIHSPASAGSFLLLKGGTRVPRRSSFQSHLELLNCYCSYLIHAVLLFWRISPST